VDLPGRIEDDDIDQIVDITRASIAAVARN
jgi:hypothetical protein